MQLAHQVNVVIAAHQDVMETQAQLDFKVLMVRREIVVPMAMLVPQDLLDKPDPQDLLDL